MGVLMSAFELSPAKRILLVDDEKHTRRSLEYILEAAGFRVISARNGRIALGLLDRFEGQRIPVHMVITDLQMPEVDGRAVVDEIRRRWVDMPVLVITGLQAPGIEEWLDGLDRVALLQKPLDDEVLVETVTHLMRV